LKRGEPDIFLIAIATQSRIVSSAFFAAIAIFARLLTEGHAKW